MRSAALLLCCVAVVILVGREILGRLRAEVDAFDLRRQLVEQRRREECASSN